MSEKIRRTRHCQRDTEYRSRANFELTVVSLLGLPELHAVGDIRCQSSAFAPAYREHRQKNRSDRLCGLSVATPTKGERVDIAHVKTPMIEIDGSTIKATAQYSHKHHVRVLYMIGRD